MLSADSSLDRVIPWWFIDVASVITQTAFHTKYPSSEIGFLDWVAVCNIKRVLAYSFSKELCSVMHLHFKLPG